MNENLKEKFKLNLQKLVGKECWGIVDSAGSHIDFRFGEKIKRQKAVDNKNLSIDVRLNEPEFSLFILCVWRIESAEKVVCGAWSESKAETDQVLNQKVVAVALEEPSFDLSLLFTNGLKLKVFCDSTNELDEADNYNFFTPTEVYAVEMHSNLIVEARELDK